MTFKEGTPIGFLDSNGIELAVGDKVKAMKKRALPNWDGWGRALPGNHETTYDESIYKGIITYNNTLCSFVIKTDGLDKNIYGFDKLEKI